MDLILEPWPWFVAGPLIALVMFLLIMVGKEFGVSSNLRTLCALCGASKTVEFFKFNWKAQRWNLTVVLGSIIGGFFASEYLTKDESVSLNTITIENLKSLGFNNAGNSYLPSELFAISVKCLNLLDLDLSLTVILTICPFSNNPLTTHEPT